MSFDPLLTLLGLASFATAADPATFAPTAARAGVRIQAAALPSTPGIGDIAIDSGAGNALKWWNGSGWQAVGNTGAPGGANQELQYNNNGSFAGIAGSVYKATAPGGSFDIGLSFSRTIDGSSFITAYKFDTTVAAASNSTSGFGVTLAAPSSSGTVIGFYNSLDTTLKAGGGLIGIRNDVNLGSGTMAGDAFIGISQSLQTMGTSVLSLSGVSTGVQVFGNVTNLYGMSFGAVLNSGTVTNLYGLYLGTANLQGGAVTNNYGVYQADGSATNYFVGRTTYNPTLTSTTGAYGVTHTVTVTANSPNAGSFFGSVDSQVTGTSATLSGAKLLAYRSIAKINPTAAGSVDLCYGATSYSNVTSSGAWTASANFAMGANTVNSFEASTSGGAANATNVYGFQTRIETLIVAGATATITNYYGIRLDAPADFGAVNITITNRFGVYQADAAAQNYLAGNTVLVPKALPTGVAGMVVVNSGNSYNKLSYYDGASWLVVATGLGLPSAEGSNRTLTDGDNGKNLICTGSRTFTVNTGLVAGFGCSFKGTVAFTGTATITDVRTSGATNPWCALCATGTDTYDIVGSKA